MEKSLLVKGELGAAAAVSLLALVWVVSIDERPPDLISGFLFSLIIIAVAGGATHLWSTFMGLLSRESIWSPGWTLLAGAMPFYLLAIWAFFFSSFEMQISGFMRLMLLEIFGTVSGVLARKKAFPHFTNKDSASTPLPPPTLFPK